MTDKNKVSVKIHGYEYKLVSDDSREYMQSIANYVDDRMTEISESNKKLSTAMVAVLTALNVADDHFKLKEEFEKVKTRMVDPMRDIDNTKEKIQVFSDELERRNHEYDEMRTQFKRLLDGASHYEQELETLKEKLHVLSYELEYKARELQASDDKIKQLETQVSELKDNKRTPISFSSEGGR